MSVMIPDDILGLTEANAELDRLEAADKAAEQGAAKQPKETKESATPGQRAAQTDTNTQKTETVDPTKDQGTKELKDQGTKDPNTPEKPAEKPADKSRYAKAVERQEKSWAQLNADKEALKREREEFDRAKQQEAEAKAKTESEPSAEDYDAAAKKFEDAGKFDFAEAAREKAAELRKNPKPARKTETDEPVRKEWALKAGVDFPELAKTNSPLQVRVAQLLKEEPDLKAHPKGIYMAARLADLEARSAGVAEKDKELVQLRAKVKELEILTAPGGGGVTTQPASKAFEQLDDTQQFEQLRREAQELGSLR